MNAQPGVVGSGFPLRADLHTHSTASDGADAPAALVRQASERGLSLLALTDHDTTLGIADAQRAGDALGVRVIPGIELSTNVTEGEIHVLAYGIDAAHPALQETLRRLREASMARVERMLGRLREMGYELPPGSVQPSSPGASVGRPHIARAMIAAGHVGSIAEAFDRFLNRGRPAYVERERLSPEEAVALARQADGLPTLAHPLSFPSFEERLPALIAAGLVGLEAYYGEYGEAQRQALAGVAARFGLLATGGSDYHGQGFKRGRDLGAVAIPDTDLDRFLQRLDGNHPGSD